MVPIIEKFYKNMWTSTRKETDGRNEWLSAEEEKELKSKFQIIVANVQGHKAVWNTRPRFIIDETNLRKQSKGKSKVLQKELGKSTKWSINRSELPAQLRMICLRDGLLIQTKTLENNTITILKLAKHNGKSQRRRSPEKNFIHFGLGNTVKCRQIKIKFLINRYIYNFKRFLKIILRLLRLTADHIFDFAVLLIVFHRGTLSIGEFSLCMIH